MKACTRILCLGLLLTLSACSAYATSIQEAKLLADTGHVTLDGKIVTYAGDGFFYIEEDSGCMAIRVERIAHDLTVGMRADVVGDMATNSNNERYVLATAASQTSSPNSTGTVAPVGMSNRALGGGDWSVDGTGGQKGAGNSTGLNNIGLLVRTWGQFQQIDATTFTVNDGAGQSIRCTVPAGTFLSPAWQYVSVTGISSMCDSDNSYLPLLLVRDIDVISPAEAVSTPGTPSGDASPLLVLTYAYSTTGSTCNQGHPVEYRFNWGDGTTSPWSTSTTAVHSWASYGTKTVTVTARCQAHPSVSVTSAGRSVTPAMQLTTAPWPMFRHDLRHSGVSPYHDSVPSGAAWSYTMGNGLSSPVIGRDGTIYLAGTNALYALNTAGGVKWSPAINSATRSTPAIGSDGTVYIGGTGMLYAFTSAGAPKWTFILTGDVTGSPAVGPDGVVYVGTRSGYLYAITPGTSSATQKWRTPLGDMHMTSPTVTGDGTTVYCGAGTSLWSINTANGNARWSYPLGVGMTSSVALNPSSTVAYIGAYDGNLYAINASTGTLVWRVPVGFKNAVTSASPAIAADGTIFLGSNYGSLYALNTDGSQKWIFETKADLDSDRDIRSSVAVNTDGTVILASYDGYVRGLDSATGVEKWHHLLPGHNYASPAITANGTIVTATMSGVVYGNIGGTPPTAIPPSNLTITMPSDTQATLSWTDNSSDEYGFRIERRLGTIGEYSWVINVGADVATYTGSGLQSGQIYFYRVCAYQSGGKSAFTNGASVVTPGIQTPSGLIATPVSGSQVDLTWTDRSSDELGFSIERSIGSNGLFEEIAQVGANVSSYSDTTPYPAKNYYYRVCAFDATRWSSYSNEAWALTPGKSFAEIQRGDTSRKQLALTFDAGTAAIQTTLLSTLKSNNVFCNFFITGYVAQVQGPQVLQIALDGHLIGNHTYDHPDLRYVSDDEIVRQFNSTDDMIYSVSGRHTRPYFRAPYGGRNQHVLNVAAANGFQHVYWTTDTGDSMGSTTQTIINSATAGASNGAIILFHCTAPNTAVAIPTVITNLRNLGYELVTIPEIVAPKQVTSPAGTLNAGWNLISLPIEPALEYPHIVFRGTAIDGYLARWDTKSTSQVTYSASAPWLFGNIESDEGYWLWQAAAGGTLKFNGAALTMDRHIKLPQTTVLADYALIGYPFETAQDFANCTVYNPNAADPKTRSVADAITANWIPDRFYGWDSATATQFDVSVPGYGAVSTQLEPWRGYKAAALEAGVELIIPKP